MNNPKIVIQDFRPSEIMEAYWQEVLAIEEDAVFCDVERLEA